MASSLQTRYHQFRWAIETDTLYITEAATFQMPWSATRRKRAKPHFPIPTKRRKSR